jgi:PST family polysaccharide transporter
MSSPSPEPRVVLHRSLAGLVALATRQGLVQGLNLAGSVVLARLLDPADFGVYAIGLFFAGLVGRVATSGLGANLVRRADEPTDLDCRAVFTAQQIAVVLVAAALALGARPLASLYRIPHDGDLFMRLAALSLLVGSLSTIPTCRLERHLLFQRIAAAEVAQALAFQGTAILFAWQGHGVAGFGAALLVRALVGTGLTNLLAPWRPGFTRRWSVIREHARFGVAFQGTFMVSTVKDGILTVFLGMALGTAAVGYAGWAGIAASYPVIVLMATQRVYLPTFSRLAGHPEFLGRAVEAAVEFANACAAPFAVATLVLIEPLTRLVFGPEWLPALPLFYLLWISNLFVPSATPLLSLLHALGDPGTVFRFALLWAVLTWALGVPLILAQGLIGFAVANALVQTTSLWLYAVVRGRVRFGLYAPALRVWGTAALLGAGLFAVQRARPAASVADLVLYAGGLLVAFVAALAALHRSRVRRALSILRSAP